MRAHRRRSQRPSETLPGLYWRAFPVAACLRSDLDVKHPWQRAHSWTHNGLMLRAGRFVDAAQDIIDTLGNVRTIDPTDSAEDCNAPAFNDDFGLILGYGNTANPSTAFNMASRFIQGSGVGELTYGAMTIGLPDPIYPVQQILFQRTVSNLHVDTQIATEQGLFCQFGAWEFLIAIDHLGNPVQLPPGTPTTLQYLITAQFP